MRQSSAKLSAYVYVISRAYKFLPYTWVIFHANFFFLSFKYLVPPEVALTATNTLILKHFRSCMIKKFLFFHICICTSACIKARKINSKLTSVKINHSENFFFYNDIDLLIEGSCKPPVRHHISVSLIGHDTKSVHPPWIRYPTWRHQKIDVIFFTN